LARPSFKTDNYAHPIHLSQVGISDHCAKVADKKNRNPKTAVGMYNRAEHAAKMMRVDHTSDR